MHQDAIASVWREILGNTFSGLGRLAYLSRCRNLKTDHYHHAELSRYSSDEDVDAAMRFAHELIWQFWINGSIGQQHADFLAYLTDLTTTADHLSALWLQADLVLFPPASASDQERALFLRNLKLILALQTTQNGRASERGLRSVVHLSRAEQSILGLIANGFCTKEIATLLDISPLTVATHRKRLCKKLNVHSTSELVSAAARALHEIKAIR